MSAKKAMAGKLPNRRTEIIYCVNKSAFRIYTDVCFIPEMPDISLFRRMCFRITLFFLILR